MKRKRYSVEQIVAAVKPHELGIPAEGIIRKFGIAEATLYRWEMQYGRLEPSQVRELPQLREPNATPCILSQQASMSNSLRASASFSRLKPAWPYC